MSIARSFLSTGKASGFCSQEKSQISLENSPNLETQWRPQRKTPEFPVELEEKPEKEAEKQIHARGDLGRLDRKHDSGAYFRPAGRKLLALWSLKRVKT